MGCGSPVARGGLDRGINLVPGPALPVGIPRL